jgi:hypothetical protein
LTQCDVFADETSNPNALSADIRRRRRKKDPRAPKKSLTSYLVFMQRHRAALAAANPDVSTQDLTTLLADKWKNVDEEERKLCEQIAASDHERCVGSSTNFIECFLNRVKISWFDHLIHTRTSVCGPVCMCVGGWMVSSFIYCAFFTSAYF